jgi:hypothetical protein
MTQDGTRVSYSGGSKIILACVLLVTLVNGPLMVRRSCAEPAAV